MKFKMKNIIVYLLFFILIAYSKISVAQSKTDTENWLISIIEDPEYRYNKYHTYSVNFDNGNMVIESPFLQKLYEYKIPLKSLDKIKLQKLDDGFRLILSCSNGNYIKYGEYINEDKNNYQFKSNDKQTIIMFGRNLEFDNLSTRLKKALTHIVQLNGGKIVEETF